MKKISFIILSFLISLQLYAQHLKVDGVNPNYEKYRESSYFDYIHEDFDTSNLTWVADLTITFDTIIPGMIGETYKLFKEKANRYGANSFRVRASNIYDNGPDKYVSISTYWLRMEDRDSNEVLYKNQEVYLFGFLGYHEEIDGYSVELNDQGFTMHALTFRARKFNKGERVRIHLGSKVRGSSVEFKVSEDMKSRFYYFSMMRGSFKNSSIKQYDRDFGMYLSQILQKE